MRHLAGRTESARAPGVGRQPRAEVGDREVSSVQRSIDEARQVELLEVSRTGEESADRVVHPHAVTLPGLDRGAPDRHQAGATDASLRRYGDKHRQSVRHRRQPPVVQSRRSEVGKGRPFREHRLPGQQLGEESVVSVGVAAYSPGHGDPVVADPLTAGGQQDGLGLRHPTSLNGSAWPGNRESVGRWTTGTSSGHWEGSEGANPTSE